MKINYFFLTVVVLVFFIIAIAGAGCSEEKEVDVNSPTQVIDNQIEKIRPSPEETIKKYIDALNAADVATLYNLQTSDYQNETSRIDYYNSVDLSQTEFFQITEYYDYSEKIEGDIAYITVKYVFKINDEIAKQYPGDQYIEIPMNGTMYFENGEWKLNFRGGI